jgi:hypothetical protein
MRAVSAVPSRAPLTGEVEWPHHGAVDPAFGRVWI